MGPLLVFGTVALLLGSLIWMGVTSFPAAFENYRDETSE
jgi:hypothetical protein